ncbi:MAG: ATP-binding cassette domain-containing protein [Lautropia sp.]|nr:ATP-binding cassette domain-containing protein [Lautropia sp.]
MNDVVVSEGLVKRFVTSHGDSVPALKHVSLRASSAEMTALVGPDGAGKTTFLRMVAGLMTPDEGRLQVFGSDIAGMAQDVHGRISYMPQRFGLYEDLSVRENLDLYADLYGVSAAARRGRFDRLLDMTDLARFGSRLAGNLSGGMKQKLGLICTLVRSPDLLLLDEPSVGVDPLSRRDLWDVLQQLVRHEQLAVIVATAYMDEAERCACVYVMNDGEVMASGTPDALAHRADGLCFDVTPAVGMSPKALQARLLAAETMIADAVPRGGDVRFICHPDADVTAVRDLIKPAQARDRPAGLEDTFMLLLRQRSGQPGQRYGPSPGLKGQVGHSVRGAAADRGGADAPMIVVRDLVRRFGNFTAVASTSFEVGRGEIFGLLGPNGAGKTTTFRMLCGLLPATSGTLQVAGANLRTAGAQARSRIGYVAQKFSLYANLTVRENLMFFGAAYGLRGGKRRQQVEGVIARFDLDGDAISGLLPAGYRQRLAMAAGLVHSPEILFLDEPTSGIDPLARREFWHTITDVADRGVTIVVTTHFMEEAEYCDRIVIQDAGRVLALGTPAEVRAQAGLGAGQDMNQAFIAIVEQGRRKAQAVAA